MSTYLTVNELAELVGCQPRSHTCMKRWLKKHGWPFAVNIAGVPQVSRAYFQARLSGLASATGTDEPEQEPNFEALAA
ncbi:DUF4224 domain-containing protein [Cupriavidus basilensis]|uniref:DUF4224 domain-containing protein n=1 Tax=Cupriavidus basilensis TaxID=68895 RepID=A0A7M2GQ85_9BURK|nr:DUF4224 domain-containing protein [Cupriavidus basilensis]QOT74861.1 DUF4224 domain-containing protein [Cupriavidus basilensis]